MELDASQTTTESPEKKVSNPPQKKSMIDRIPTTENKNAKGYRFARLAFIAYTVAFYVIMLLPGPIDEKDVQLYLYYCGFSSIALGVFALKDVMNLRTMILGGNGNGIKNEATQQ